MAAENPLSVRIDGVELLDALVTGVFLLDAGLRVCYLNSAAQTLVGLGSNQVLGRRLTDILRGAQSLASLLERARMAGEGVVQRELTWPVPGAGERILDCSVSRVVLGSEATPVLVEIEDITQHRRLARESALLAQLDGSRQMVRQLAHEIKNPLGGLRGAAQLLERELPDPSLREYTRVIISEADRLAGLLDSMLGPGRPTTRQGTNVHELLERVYHLMRSEASRDVVITRDYDPSLPPLTVDPNHIIQAMLNLGRNALQSLSSANTASPRLTLRTRAQAGVSIGAIRHRAVALIEFEDNGPGVPAGIRDTLFYPLVSGRADGTGIGLGIAQDLVSRHGGLIEFDSIPGRTVFTILLPLDPP